ncbi:PWI domain-containing protein [Phytophthora infestans]|nr:PWI domain-containing protein [Phytophthora infestans]
MAVRGTSASQDGRYLAQEKKLLAAMTFPKCFERSVDMRKVQREVINQWITERVTQLLGFEDDIVVSMAINLLETKVDEKLDPKNLQVALTGFLEKQAGSFVEELWQLLLSAQSNPTGIPSAILDKKKQEMQSIAQEKNKLKKVLDIKKKENEGQSRPQEDDVRNERRERRRSRSLQRRPRSPPRRFRSPRRSPSVKRRSRSLPRRRRRSPSPRRRPRSPRRRSRSSPPGRSRRGRSRSPSLKRRRRDRSASRSRERHSERMKRSQRRERSRRFRRSPSSSSSASRHRSPSSSRSPSPPRRRSRASCRKDSTDSGSESD